MLAELALVDWSQILTFHFQIQYSKVINLLQVSLLTLFLPMLPFDPTRNKMFYDIFRGIKKEHKG